MFEHCSRAFSLIVHRCFIDFPRQKRPPFHCDRHKTQGSAEAGRLARFYLALQGCQLGRFKAPGIGEGSQPLSDMSWKTSSKFQPFFGGAMGHEANPWLELVCSCRISGIWYPVYETTKKHAHTVTYCRFREYFLHTGTVCTHDIAIKLPRGSTIRRGPNRWGSFSFKSDTYGIPDVNALGVPDWISLAFCCASLFARIGTKCILYILQLHENAMLSLGGCVSSRHVPSIRVYTLTCINSLFFGMRYLLP